MQNESSKINLINAGNWSLSFVSSSSKVLQLELKSAEHETQYY